MHHKASAGRLLKTQEPISLTSTVTDELKRSNERLKILSETSAKLLLTNNPQELVNELCDMVMNYLDCQVFFNYLTEESTGKLCLNSCAGIPESAAARIKYLEKGSSVCSCVAEFGHRIIAENIQESEDPKVKLVKSFGVKAYACHPLLSGNTVLGTLSFGTTTRTCFSSEDVSLMKTVTDEVAIAMNRVRFEKALRESEARSRENANSLARLNRTLNSLSRSRKAMMHATSEQSYIDEVCRIIINDCGHSMVWVGYIQNDEDGTVKPVAYSGFEEGYISNLRISCNNPKLGNGPTGRSIKTGQVIVCRDMKSDPSFEPWRKEALKRGYSSSIVFPLKIDGFVFGVLSIYSREKDAFSDEEIKLLSELGDDLAYGINGIRRSESEKKAVEAIRESEEKLNLALENGNIGTWTYNIITGKMDWDERMERIFGLQKGTFNGTLRFFESCIAEEDVSHIRKTIAESLQNGTPFETIFRIKKDGGFSYISSKASLVRDERKRPLKISGVCFDITGMKNDVGIALFKLNEELLRSNRELEQFAYVASHDLQEPLRMVSSFTQLLQLRYGEKLDDDAREFIRYAVEGASRMQNLINDLLDFSRISTRPGRLRNVEMNKAVDLTLYNLKFNIDQRSAVITRDDLP
ncbi:MAG TPA: GAF domain-containing protein, partial [Bacteroidales bacterium]|nr:GAF domain-containing protein [Bacteroidales bacterium]